MENAPWLFSIFPQINVCAGGGSGGPGGPSRGTPATGRRTPAPSGRPPPRPAALRGRPGDPAASDAAQLARARGATWWPRRALRPGLPLHAGGGRAGVPGRGQCGRRGDGPARGRAPAAALPGGANGLPSCRVELAVPWPGCPGLDEKAPNMAPGTCVGVSSDCGFLLLTKVHLLGKLLSPYPKQLFFFFFSIHVKYIGIKMRKPSFPPRVTVCNRGELRVESAPRCQCGGRRSPPLGPRRLGPRTPCTAGAPPPGVMCLCTSCLVEI